MVLERPVAGVKLGVPPKSTTIFDAVMDAIEALQGQVGERTAPSIVTTDGFPEIPAVLLHSADTLSDAAGTWSVSGGFSGAVAVLDTVNKTQGTASVSGDLSFPSGAGTDGKLVFTPNTPIPVGFHTDFDIDLRWTLGSGSGSQLGFEVVVASGPGLTGAIVLTKTMSVAAPTENVFTTVAIHLAGTGLTSIGSFGVRKKATSAGQSSKHVIFKLDRPELSATTSIDRALATPNRTVVVSPDYTSTLTQALVMLGSTQSLHDLRPSKINESKFRGVKDLRDYLIDETGVTDVTASIQAIFNSLQPGDLLTAPPGAKYRVDNHIFLTKSNVTIDMQGARFFAPTLVADAMFSIQGDYVTLLNWRIFGRAPSTTNLGTSLSLVSGPAAGVVGTAITLGTAGQEVRIPLRPSTGQEPSLTERYSRDEDGFLQFDLSLSQAVPVAGDVIVSVTPHIPGTDAFGAPVFDYQQTLTLTPTQTTYPIKFYPRDPFARTRFTIKKVTTGNPITIHSVVSYRKFQYLTSQSNPAIDYSLNAALKLSGTGMTIENCWCEGMGGDGVQIRGDDASGLRIRNFFARGVGRECIEISQGKDILIEDFVLAGCARDTINLEPETDADAISNVRFRNGIIGTGRNIGFVCSGGVRSDRVTFDDIWVRSDIAADPADEGTVWESDFVDGGAIRNLVYTFEGVGAPKIFQITGDGNIIDNVTLAGSLTVGGTNAKVGTLRLMRADQEGTLIATGTGHHFDDVTIGDPNVPVVIDTALAFNPVQLAPDTTYGRIKVPLWKTEFGNTYKSAIATGQPWWPRGLDMNGGGVRELRGLSASLLPANNLAGTKAVSTGATTLAIDFPVRTDVMNPLSFTLTATGPHVTSLRTDAEGTGGLAPTGTWTVTYNGVTSAPISVNASAATVQSVLNGLSTMPPSGVVVTAPFAAGLGNGGLTLTWAATLGDLPSTLFTAASINIQNWKGNAKPVSVSTSVTGGWVVPNKQYWYRVAGRTFEGQPLAGLAVKKLILGAAQNTISVSFGSPRFDQISDLKVTGATIWRAGPFTIDGVTTYTGDYTKRVDLPGTQDFSHPAGGTDRETAFSGLPWVDGVYTTAEVSTNESGWERDDRFHLGVSTTWPTEVGVKKRANGSGADLTFGTACPGTGGPHSVTWDVLRYV